MTLKSALEDLRETTLAAIQGLLAKLSYLGSLRRDEGYAHWGLSQVHGAESSVHALQTAHAQALSDVLRTSLPTLVEDLHESSEGAGTTPSAYVAEMQEHYNALVPDERRDSPAARHLSSVLLALSSLEKYGQSRAARKGLRSRAPRDRAQN